MLKSCYGLQRPKEFNCSAAKWLVQSKLVSCPAVPLIPCSGVQRWLSDLCPPVTPRRRIGDGVPGCSLEAHSSKSATYHRLYACRHVPKSCLGICGLRQVLPAKKKTIAPFDVTIPTSQSTSFPPNSLPTSSTSFRYNSHERSAIMAVTAVHHVFFL